MSFSSATPLLIKPDPTLKGGLQAVLRSLDVQLEDELTRYRRQKRKLAQAETSSPSERQPRPTQVTTAREAIADLNAIAAQVPTASTPAISATTAQPQPAITTLGSLGNVPLHSSLVKVAEPREASAQSHPPSPTSSGVSTSTDSQNKDSQSKDSLGEVPVDDYFASSAALLESLAAEEELTANAGDRTTAPNATSPFLDKMMTPAGVGASLLLLLGSATAGYLILHPESLDHLHLAALLPDPTINAGAPASTSSVQPQVVNPKLPPGSPDLSQKEFVDLNLSNLSIIDPNGELKQSPMLTSSALPLAIAPQQFMMAPGGLGQAGIAAGISAGTPAIVPPSPNPTAPQSGLLSNLANSVAGQSPVQVATPIPLPSVIPPAPTAALPQLPSIPPAAPVQPAPPAQTASPAAPKAVTTPKAEGKAQGQTYVVFAPYTSDLTLSQIQQIVPDAYLNDTESGTQIQAGVFEDADTANSLADQLQREGIEASVSRR